MKDSESKACFCRSWLWTGTQMGVGPIRVASCLKAKWPWRACWFRDLWFMRESPPKGLQASAPDINLQTDDIQTNSMILFRSSIVELRGPNTITKRTRQISTCVCISRQDLWCLEWDVGVLQLTVDASVWHKVLHVALATDGPLWLFCIMF